MFTTRSSSWIFSIISVIFFVGVFETQAAEPPKFLVYFNYGNQITRTMIEIYPDGSGLKTNTLDGQTKSSTHFQLSSDQIDAVKSDIKKLNASPLKATDGGETTFGSSSGILEAYQSTETGGNDLVIIRSVQRSKPEEKDKVLYRADLDTLHHLEKLVQLQNPDGDQWFYPVKGIDMPLDPEKSSEIMIRLSYMHGELSIPGANAWVEAAEPTKKLQDDVYTYEVYTNPSQPNYFQLRVTDHSAPTPQIRAEYSGFADWKGDQIQVLKLPYSGKHKADSVLVSCQRFVKQEGKQ